jgi:hypothetical protein
MEQLPAKIRRRGTLKNLQEQRLISRQNKMTMNPGARPAARTEHEMYLGSFFFGHNMGKASDRPPARYTPSFEPGYFHLGQGDVTPPVYGQAGYAACSALKQDVLRVHAAVDGLFRVPLVYVYCSISSRVGALKSFKS